MRRNDLNGRQGAEAEQTDLVTVGTAHRKPKVDLPSSFHDFPLHAKG
jgi:hypothetical protein